MQISLDFLFCKKSVIQATFRNPFLKRNPCSYLLEAGALKGFRKPFRAE
jgi:hypothetical protein